MRARFGVGIAAYVERADSYLQHSLTLAERLFILVFAPEVKEVAVGAAVYRA